jgi:hypothetical protein
MFLGNIWKLFYWKCDRPIGAAGVPRYHLEISWRFPEDVWIIPKPSLDPRWIPGSDPGQPPDFNSTQKKPGGNQAYIERFNELL